MLGALLRPYLAREASATPGITAAQQGTIGNNNVAAVAAASPKALPFFLVVLRCWGWFEDKQPAVSVANFVLEGSVTARGMIGAHSRSSFLGAMPRDVDASPRRFYSVRTSPLYHNIAESLLPWPMESRAVAELGVSIESIIEEYAER